VVSEIIFKKS
jgi:membrane protein involved in colicin uptake